MLLVGLTGGIGSGKSTVARLLEKRGAVVFDADLLAREVVEPGTPGHAAVIERFGAAGIPAANVSFARDTYRFNFDGAPSELVDRFRNYYGPTMNAFDAAEANGRTAELQHELETLFNSQNTNPTDDATSIPATFLRVTVAV